MLAPLLRLAELLSMMRQQSFLVLCVAFKIGVKWASQLAQIFAIALIRFPPEKIPIASAWKAV